MGLTPEQTLFWRRQVRVYSLMGMLVFPGSSFKKGTRSFGLVVLVCFVFKRSQARRLLLSGRTCEGVLSFSTLELFLIDGCRVTGGLYPWIRDSDS
jgi:hypothetical protein